MPLAWVRERILATRASKGMLLDENDPDTHGVGSFFQNAIVPEARGARTAAGVPALAGRARSRRRDRDPARVVRRARRGAVDAEPADVKVSAAWLIEQAGIRKGFKLPRSRASVSTKHALALTNRGGATAAEVAELARFIQSRVHAEFGLVLQPEPVLVDVEL